MYIVWLSQKTHLKDMLCLTYNLNIFYLNQVNLGIFGIDISHLWKDPTQDFLKGGKIAIPVAELVAPCKLSKNMKTKKSLE